MHSVPVEFVASFWRRCLVLCIGAALLLSLGLLWGHDYLLIPALCLALWAGVRVWRDEAAGCAVLCQRGQWWLYREQQWQPVTLDRASFHSPRLVYLKLRFPSDQVACALLLFNDHVPGADARRLRRWVTVGWGANC